MIYDFLIFMVLLLAWFSIISREGEICSHGEHEIFERHNFTIILVVMDKIHDPKIAYVQF